MKDKMTCEEFNSRLAEFTLGGMSEEDAACMKGHISSCAGCSEILEIKRALVFAPGDPEEQVPEAVEKELVEAVISDVAAAREAESSRRSWTRRFLMPAMAAAIVIFVFLTGLMLGEIRGLNREAGELRKDVSVMETVLAGRHLTADGSSEELSVFDRISGSLQPDRGAITVGEAVRFLRALPADTPVLSEREAERLITGDPRLRRLAGYIDEKPWEKGLTSGELLLVIIRLDIDPETRIPDEWQSSY